MKILKKAIGYAICVLMIIVFIDAVLWSFECVSHGPGESFPAHCGP